MLNWRNTLNQLQLGKAAGADRLVAKHIAHAAPSLIIHLKLFFSLFLSHSFDKYYRPITLSPVISKLFENVLLELYGEHLVSSDLHFGFKKKLGCPSAICMLGQLTEFFNSGSSNVYIASLDASKALIELIILDCSQL